MKRIAVYLVVAVIAIGYFTDSNSEGEIASNPVSGITSTPSAESSSNTESATPEPTETLSATPAPAVTETAKPTTGLSAQLASLQIKGRAPKTGYDRDLFGRSWIDVDRNGCDTRNDILARDLVNVTFRSGTNNCVVESGTVIDPYTGTEFAFVKSSTGGGMDVDHIVSLSDAWQKGAQQWNSETRKQFANDPLNLVATDSGVNRSKSDSDAASWLPPNKQIRCAFIARQVAVKVAYQLWVTQAEFDAMSRVLTGCPEQPIANSGPLLP